MVTRLAAAATNEENVMDTAFAKIVTDAYGLDHLLVEGTLISLNAPRETNNDLVEALVRGLRRQSGPSSIVSQTAGAAELGGATPANIAG